MRVSKKTLEQIEAALPSMKNEVELPNMPPETNLPSALRELREMVEAGIHSRCAKRVRVRQDGGPGGFIDTYKEDGTLIGTFAKGFPLNQPWRYAWAPGEFRPLEQHLAGLQQTDTGTINAFNAKGQFVGTTKRGVRNAYRHRSALGDRFRRRQYEQLRRQRPVLYRGSAQQSGGNIWSHCSRRSG